MLLLSMIVNNQAALTTNLESLKVVWLQVPAAMHNAKESRINVIITANLFDYVAGMLKFNVAYCCSYVELQ
jgi:hypothetical protein